jgi:hypothetical protein
MGILDAKEDIVCELCRGWGHKTKNCPSLGSMNKATCSTPGLKAAWGTFKSRSVKRNVLMAMNKSIIDRKLLKKQNVIHAELIEAQRKEAWLGSSFPEPKKKHTKM